MKNSKPTFTPLRDDVMALDLQLLTIYERILICYVLRWQMDGKSKCRVGNKKLTSVLTASDSTVSKTIRNLNRFSFFKSKHVKKPHEKGTGWFNVRYLIINEVLFEEFMKSNERTNIQEVDPNEFDDAQDDYVDEQTNEEVLIDQFDELEEAEVVVQLPSQADHQVIPTEPSIQQEPEVQGTSVMTPEEASVKAQEIFNSWLPIARRKNRDESYANRPAYTRLDMWDFLSKAEKSGEHDTQLLKNLSVLITNLPKENSQALNPISYETNTNYSQL